MVQWILKKYPFENSGEQLKGIVKLLFVLNFIFIWIAYIVGALVTLFVDAEVFFWVALGGFVGCLVEIAVMYIALLGVYALAELSANSCVLVARRQYSAAEAAEEEKEEAPADHRPQIPVDKIPAWK